MNQSTYIAGALIAGFVLFLATRQRLGVYAGVLWGATNAPTPTGGTSQQSSSGAGNIFSDILKTLPFLSEFGL